MAATAVVVVSVHLSTGTQKKQSFLEVNGMERKWKLFDTLMETIGAEELALSLCKAMSLDDMNSNLEYIANCFEIEDEEDEEE